jgi:hypothetical protein
MAQTIKIKRGGIGAIGSATPTTSKGELVLGTGSFSNGLSSSLFIAEADNTLKLSFGRIDSISDGPALASDIGTNTAFTGLLIHSASDNKFYRYDGSSFQELQISAGAADSVPGILSNGTGIGTLSYNGSGDATVGIAAEGVGVNEIAGAIAGDGLSGGAGSALSVNVAGGIEIDSDNVRLSAQGDGIAGGAGSTLSVQNLNDTITVAAGGISVNTGSIAANGTNLVNADVINTLSASIASDIVANTGNVEGVSGQVAYFDGTNSVSGSTGFTFASDVLTVGGSTFGANVTVTGDLTVSGTTTTINSTTLNIDDNIIVVNYGGSETDAGIQAIDNTGTTGTGSLLWDGTNDWWKAGKTGTEKRVVTFDANSGGTENNIQKLDANSYLVDSSLTDDGTTVTVASNVDLTLTGTGQLTVPEAVVFSGLTGATNDNDAQVAFVDSTGIIGEIPTTVDSSATATGFLGYSSDNVLEFVSTIDGGTF